MAQAPPVLQAFRRRLYYFLLTFTRCSTNAPNPFKHPFGLYAKTGLHAYGVIQGALTLQVIADYNSIPVPDVLDLFNGPAHEGGPMLIMSRSRGTPLSRTRQSLDSLSPNQLTTIADTLP
jgi:hypothetical protein